MVLLVVSNCAMVPAVMFSLQQHYYFVATLLSISSISSGLYHLCDSDVYCIAGLNFHSLQVSLPCLHIEGVGSQKTVFSTIFETKYHLFD